MKVKVLFQGILSEWMGEKQVEVDLLEDRKFAALLQELKDLYGPKMPPQLWDEKNKNFNPSVWALRGKERIVDPLTPLQDGEEITFLLGIAGG